MKWIKSRAKFLTEAKLRDVLLEPQKKRLVEVWGERFLDYEEIKPTEKIKQGRWKLSDEDRDAVINRFFKTDYAWVREKLNSLPDRFANVLSKSLQINPNDFSTEQGQRLKAGFKEGEEFNIKKLKISQISCLNLAIFKSLNASETKSDVRIVRNEQGQPVRDENNNIIKEPKEPGDPSFSRNLTNLNTFISGYNTSYPDEKVDASIFTDSNIQNITNMITDNPDIIDFDLFGDHEMFLMIEHNAVNIMNMSISKFYKSCQEMYFGGGHGTQYMKGLLLNVFDPNTIPAFLVFNTPYYNITKEGGTPEKLSDVLPLCRLLLRVFEPFDSDQKSTGVYFDKTYPDRMKDILSEMIEKYSGNKKTDDFHKYYYLTPDINMIDYEDFGSDPYMDTLTLKKGIKIGKNTKSLYLSNNFDWSTAVVDPESRPQEIVIETDMIPQNFFDMKFNPEWIKFKYLIINDISKFKNIITDSLSFYQCKLKKDFIQQLSQISPNLKKLSLGSVRLKDIGQLTILKDLEDLELLYTIGSKSDLSKVLNGLPNLKNLSISGDLLASNKEYIDTLRKNGVKVNIKGLVI